ncbi:hypothetical protein AJ79_03046 [Helicocarpus griseus UAMH5409]|uniref:Probable aspartic-type endopeptidase OPSB n=1 Tax=Helicocarpus griseus UAMH5409 TaxID=1447875 RepID=A0A2B7Y051_9EURO|nr:hypothetical protein AJ79_03046 [Helicocarpus griseus UAMH5409]
MRGITLCGLGTALLSALPAITAIQLVSRDAPHVVSLDIERRPVSNPVERDKLRKRQDKVVEQTLENERTLYFCNITLGTPEQRLRMHIDTGSSDLWCNAANSTLCTQRNDPCANGGTYDPNASSTYNFVNPNFNITYVDGSGALGDYVTDTLKLGEATLQDFQFGVGYQSTSNEGVLGIGYPLNEVQVGRNKQPPYPNLPVALVNDGQINSNAYSLWLNDLDASTGSILFGGVNAAKFEGTLETLPIVPIANDIYAELAVSLTSMSVQSNQGNQRLSRSLPTTVVLDSGSSLCYLPDLLVAELYRLVDATYDPEMGAAYVPCSLGRQQAWVTFTFTRPSIRVGMDELVINLGPNPDGSIPQFSNGEPACVFGIAPAGRGNAILGDTFLRSAYVVYDLANNQISLAKTNFNATGEDRILEIGTGPNSVPEATGVPDAAPTGGGGGGGGGTTATSVGVAAPTLRPDLQGAVVGLAGMGVVFAAM